MSGLRDSLLQRRAATALRERSCHQIDAAVPSLSVCCDNGETIVLPWSNFSQARHVQDGTRERLTLAFVTHAVHATGQRLETLLPIIAQFHLSLVRSLPAKYAAVNASEPHIEELAVEAIRNTNHGSSADSSQSKPDSSNDGHVGSQYTPQP